MNIVNELMNGTVEYRDDVAIQRPPTALATRAAKLIQVLATTQENNVVMINALQLREQSNLEEIEVMRKEITLYEEATRQLKVQNETNDEEHINTSL